MDSSDLTGLLPIILIFGALCLIAVSGIVILIVFVTTLRRTSQAFSAQPEKQGEEFLTAAELRPWTSSAWSDLSSRYEGWWRNLIVPGRASGYTQGIIKSVKEPDGKGWIAFTFRREFARTANLVLKTSERRLEVSVVGKSNTDRNVQATVSLDGSPAGTIAVTHPTCVYRDEDGKTQAQWVAEVRWNKEFRVGQRVMSRGVNYDNVTVGGRTIAAIADTWIRYPHPESKNPIHPALQSVASNLKQTEQDVLLIALGMALYYDNLRNRVVIYDW